MPTLIETLVAAFADDPLHRWLYPDRSAREDALWWTFGLLVAAGRRSGAVHADPTGAAVAVWTPPGVALLDRGGEQALVAGLRRRVGSRAAHAAAGSAMLTGPPPPAQSWTLHCVGVHPAQQGRGLGARLLAPVLLGSDAAGLRMYADSSNARNHGFFERLGFDVVAETPVEAGGPLVSTMVRRAALVAKPAHLRRTHVWPRHAVRA